MVAAKGGEHRLALALAMSFARSSLGSAGNALCGCSKLRGKLPPRPVVCKQTQPDCVITLYFIQSLATHLLQSIRQLFHPALRCCLLQEAHTHPPQ